ncbi:MAG: GNAT family N-acetyltransferase [Bacteroidales bacterium]|nr:GNAT family N-acetyltransferase [Bacteroidales bacterium]MBR5834196.1 GNAT family N-acetyltransferase [Bacteroidales bacterium]
MAEYKLVKASLEDAGLLCEVFIGHISSHKEYISHGEIQMGVGVGHFEDGAFVTDLAPAAREAWMKYINGNIADEEGAAVYKAVDEEGNLLGFCVTEIMEDGAEPFGMICDLLVRENCRCGGVGTALMENALAWLRSKGVKDVYLESGMHNHAAHEYFIRRGFRKVSEIYKLM